MIAVTHKASLCPFAASLVSCDSNTFPPVNRHSNLWDIHIADAPTHHVLPCSLAISVNSFHLIPPGLPHPQPSSSSFFCFTPLLRPLHCSLCLDPIHYCLYSQQQKPTLSSRMSESSLSQLTQLHKLDQDHARERNQKRKWALGEAVPTRGHPIPVSIMKDLQTRTLGLVREGHS